MIKPVSGVTNMKQMDNYPLNDHKLISYLDELGLKTSKEVLSYMKDLFTNLCKKLWNNAYTENELINNYINVLGDDKLNEYMVNVNENDPNQRINILKDGEVKIIFQDFAADIYDYINSKNFNDNKDIDKVVSLYNKWKYLFS
jgi:hypothetical protein